MTAGLNVPPLSQLFARGERIGRPVARRRSWNSWKGADCAARMVAVSITARAKASVVEAFKRIGELRTKLRARFPRGAAGERELSQSPLEHFAKNGLLARIKAVTLRGARENVEDV